jgi:hypothetical protein
MLWSGKLGRKIILTIVFILVALTTLKVEAEQISSAVKITAVKENENEISEEDKMIIEDFDILMNLELLENLEFLEDLEVLESQGLSQTLTQK